MAALGFAVSLFGALIVLIGIVFFFAPMIGLPLIAAGGFIVWVGQLIRYKAREQAVNRRLGG